MTKKSAISTTDSPSIALSRLELGLLSRDYHRDITAFLIDGACCSLIPVFLRVNIADKKSAADSRMRARASKKTTTLKARCSFKMVISRPREHFARGQFNSGRMIARSRFPAAAVPFSFLRFSAFVYPGLGCHPIPLVRTRIYTPARPCDFSIARSLCRFFFFSNDSPVRRSRRSRASVVQQSTFSPPPFSFFLAPANGGALSIPSNYFDGNCFSLVSIRVYSTRNFPRVINRSDQASSSINIKADLSHSRLLYKFLRTHYTTCVQV